MNDNIILSGEFADFETSIQLKELGFNDPCLRYYDEHGKQHQTLVVNQKQYYNQSCSAPLWVQVALFLKPSEQNSYNELINTLTSEIKTKHSELVCG